MRRQTFEEVVRVILDRMDALQDAYRKDSGPELTMDVQMIGLLAGILKPFGTVEFDYETETYKLIAITHEITIYSKNGHTRSGYHDSQEPVVSSQTELSSPNGKTYVAAHGL